MRSLTTHNINERVRISKDSSNLSDAQVEVM